MTSKRVLMAAPYFNPGTDGKSSEPVSRETGKFLFTYAKVAKDRAQNLLDIDASGEAPQVIGRGPQGLGHEFQLIGGKRRSPQEILYARRRDLLVTRP